MHRVHIDLPFAPINLTCELLAMPFVPERSQSYAPDAKTQAELIKPVDHL